MQDKRLNTTCFVDRASTEEYLFRIRRAHCVKAAWETREVGNEKPGSRSDTVNRVRMHAGWMCFNNGKWDQTGEHVGIHTRCDNPAIRSLEVGNPVIDNHIARRIDLSRVRIYRRTTILGQSDVKFRSVCNDKCPKNHHQLSFRTRRRSQEVGYRFLSMIVRRSYGSQRRYLRRDVNVHATWFRRPSVNVTSIRCKRTGSFSFQDFPTLIPDNPSLPF